MSLSERTLKELWGSGLEMTHFFNNKQVLMENVSFQDLTLFFSFIIFLTYCVCNHPLIFFYTCGIFDMQGKGLVVYFFSLPLFGKCYVYSVPLFITNSSVYKFIAL